MVLIRKTVSNRDEFSTSSKRQFKKSTFRKKKFQFKLPKNSNWVW